MYEATYSLDYEMSLMFDFGMEVGDTIDYSAFMYSSLYDQFVVTDKSIIQLEDGLDRIQIELSRMGSSQKSSWIQRIGWQQSGPIIYYNTFTDLKCVTAADGDIYLADNFSAEDCDKRACLALSAYFTIEDSEDNKVYLSNKTENIDEIEMHMGDGNVFDEFISEYEYQEKGCYDIEVTVSNSCEEESYWHQYFDYCEDPKWYKKESVRFIQMSFYSSNLGLAIEKDSVFKTTDGGVSWSFKTRLINASSTNFDGQSLFLSTEDIAIATLRNTQLEDKIFVSIDGGDNWKAVYNGPLDIRDATISDQGTIIAVSNKEMICSKDYGETWSIIEREEISGTFQLSNFVGSKIATVDRFFDGSSNQYMIQVSKDFGVTWSTIPFDEPIFGIYFLTGDIAYLGGYNTIYKTVDAGSSWTEVKKIKGTESFYLFSFSDENNGIATTREQIYVTEDGGQSWELENCKNVGFIRAAHAFTESGYVQRYKSLYERAPNPDFECENIVSTINQLQLAVEIAPNPSSDYFHIIGNREGSYQVEIRDVTGAIQKTKNVLNVESIDINDLSMGLYLVSIQKEGLRQTLKLVKH